MDDIPQQIVPDPFDTTTQHAHTGTDGSPQISYNDLKDTPTALPDPLTPAHGGTGLTSLTSHYVLVGNGTGNVTPVSPDTSGKVFTSNGPSSDPSFQTLNAVAIGSSTTGQFSSNLQDDGNSGTSKTINWANGNRHKLTLTGNCTLTFSNPISGATYTLELVQDGTGSRTVTWPSIKWAGGVSPLLSTGAGSIDIISIFYDGTNYFGTYSIGFA